MVVPNMQTAYLKWQAVWGKHRLTIIFGLVYVVLSLFAIAHFLNSSYLGDRYFKTNFDGMYEGTTFKPFVYRQLVPSLARAATAVSPESLKGWVNDGIEAIRKDPAYDIWRTTMPWLDKAFPSTGKHYQRIVTILIIYGCLWGYIWALMALSRQVFPISPAMEYMTPVFGVLLISCMSYPFQYVYDIPVLFLSTACFYYLASRRWIPYLLFFFLGCLNKETIGFVFVFSAIWFFRRLDWRTYINLMLAQYIIFALVRILLLYIYSANAGEYVKNHLFRVLPGDIFTTSQYVRMMHICWIFFLLTFQWPKKPAFLKCGLWLLLPMYVCYLFYGMPGEYRVFFDVLILPLLLGVHTLVEASGLARSPFFSSPSLKSTSTPIGNNHDSSD